MAVFNNGRITASVTPPQGFTGSYRYTLYKYDQSIGDWAVVIGAEEGDEGFTGTFINPIIKVEPTHVFGNPGTSDENIEGDPDSWVGLVPGNYKVRVEAIGTDCVVETTSTVGTQDPGDPEFTCADTSITIPNGTVGDTVTATATNGVVGIITPSEYQNGTQSYDVEITVPAGYSNVGSIVTCTASATGSVALSPFTCANTSITIANGTAGDTIPTSAVTATGVSNIIAVYAAGITTPATYFDGTQAVDVVFEVPAGYSNTGDSFTCSANATGTPALTEFTCTDANFQVADGTTNQDVVATVAAGTLNSVSPAQYVEGSATYTANITVPATGYSNSGATLTTCTDIAVGTTVTGDNIIYYFHGFDDVNQEPWATESGTFEFADQGFCEPNGDYYLANSIGGGQGDLNSTPRTLDDIMAHLIDNVTVGNYSMISEDTGGNIVAAGNPNATVLNFPATPGVDAQYYFAVPQSLTAINYTSSGTVNLTNQPDGTSALPGQAADRKAFSYGGSDYWLYRMSTASQGQNYLGFNS
jgi:hypothetical protein